MPCRSHTSGPPNPQTSIDSPACDWTVPLPLLLKDFAPLGRCANLSVVEVVLRKVGKRPGRAVVGRLLRPPRKGSVVVIEFPDGLHEYVTTPVKRVLKLCDRDVYYIQTANSRYRLEVRSGEGLVIDEAPVAK